MFIKGQFQTFFNEQLSPKTTENVQKYQIHITNHFRTISANFGLLRNPERGPEASENNRKRVKLSFVP